MVVVPEPPAGVTLSQFPPVEVTAAFHATAMPGMPVMTRGFGANAAPATPWKVNAAAGTVSVRLESAKLILAMNASVKPPAYFGWAALTVGKSRDTVSPVTYMLPFLS